MVNTIFKTKIKNNDKTVFNDVSFCVYSNKFIKNIYLSNEKRRINHFLVLQHVIETRGNWFTNYRHGLVQDCNISIVHASGDIAVLH